MSTAYKTNYGFKGSQKCRVIATFYSEKDGEPENEAINNFYWAMKEGSGLDIETGYRVYRSLSFYKTKYQGGKTSFNYSPDHPEITKEIPAEEEEDEE